MTKLIRLALILFVICASVITATWLIGHLQPLTSAVLFTNPDSTSCTQPCAFGIQPSQTSHAGALVLLRTHPLIRHLTCNLEGDIVHDQAASIILNLDSQDRVASIRLAKRPNATALGNGSVIDQVINAAAASDLFIDSPPLAQSSSESD